MQPGCLTHVCSVPQSAEKLQESPCIFALTPRQVEMIRNSRWAGRRRSLLSHSHPFDARSCPGTYGIRWNPGSLGWGMGVSLL